MVNEKKEHELAELNRTMAASCLCELRKTALNVVPGIGSADARLLFIGEAPGKKEDETGEPFVGAAGKFLNEMLASIGLNREDIYITNVVKYRPPNNRDPLPEEVAACWPWLRAQVELIAPKSLFFWGGTRLNGLCRESAYRSSMAMRFAERFPILAPMFSSRSIILPLRSTTAPCARLL